MPSPRSAKDVMRLPSPSSPYSARFMSDEAAAEKALKWVENVTGERLKEGSFADVLKDGQALCKLINTIKPGTIAKIETSVVAFKQMANISSFIHACRAFGVRDHSLFETLDLFNEKRPSQVVRCLFALSDVIQTSGLKFQGPHLSSLDRPGADPVAQAVVEISKGNASAPGWDKALPVPDHGAGQVVVAETPSSIHLTLPRYVHEAVGRCHAPQPLSPADAAGHLTFGVYEGGGSAVKRSASPPRGTGPGRRAPESQNGRVGLSENSSESSRCVSKLLTREEEQLRAARHLERVDAEMEVALWVEGVTGETFPGRFWSSLKDGVLLCKVINAINPGLVPRINTAKAPFPEMENIMAFLNACRTLGVAEHSLFDVVDLHEKKDLHSVVRCMHVLSATVQNTMPDFRGPFLGRKTDSLSKANAKGLRKWLGTGQGAQGGLLADGFLKGHEDLEKVHEEEGVGTAANSPVDSPAIERVSTPLRVRATRQVEALAGEQAVACPIPTSPASNRSPEEALAMRTPSPTLPRFSRPCSPGCVNASPSQRQDTLQSHTAQGEERLLRRPQRVPQSMPRSRGLRLADLTRAKAEQAEKDVKRAEASVNARKSRLTGCHSDRDAGAVDKSVVAQLQIFIESRTRWAWRVDGNMYESLRDGWQLALLANALRPGAVRSIHNSIIPAKHRRNISSFLTACRRMGVASALIFDVEDLHGNKNMSKVARTLLALRALAEDPDFARCRPKLALEASLIDVTATRSEEPMSCPVRMTPIASSAERKP